MSRCRLFAGLVAAAVIATGSAVAVAATPVTSPTAKITTSTDLAPGANTMKFDVKNTSDPSHVIDYVRIYQPANIALSAAVAPAGWTASTLSDDNSILFKPTVGGLPGGATLTFGVTATTAAPVSDRLQNWSVATRFTGADRTLYPARAAAAGDLTTVVRVLKVTTTPSAPSFTPAPGTPTATALQFTTGQDNRLLTYTVEYVGSGNPATVAAALTTSGGDTWTATSTALGSATKTATLDVPVKFGGVGTGRVMKVSAMASGNGVTADAPKVDTAKFDVQSAFAPTQAAALTPTVLTNTTGAQTFTLKVSNTGDSIGKLDVANTALSFTRIGATGTNFTVPLKTPQDVAKSSTLAPSTTLTFEGGVPTGFLDGSYDIALTYGKWDNHGALATGSLPVVQDLLIDTLFPKVTGLTLAPADGARAGSAGELVTAANANTERSYVFTRGDTLNFAGTVDTDATGVTCVIEWTDSTVAEIGSSDAECEIGDGNALTGSYDVLLTPPGATAARLVVTVEDAAGLTGVNTSAPALLDLTAPRIGTSVASLLGVELPEELAKGAGRTGCAGLAAPCTAARTLTVTFDEPVVGGFGPADFTVVSASTNVVHPVTSVIGADATRYTTTATLIVSNVFGEDTTPVVTYLRLPTSSATAVADAAGNILSLLPATIADGIAPRHPVLSKVQNKDAVGGEFWTNNNETDFVVTGLSPGHSATVLLDDGNATTPDTMLCSGASDDLVDLDGVTCTGTLPATDGAYVVYVLATDKAGNSSIESPTAPVRHTVQLDTVVPTLTSAQLVSDGGGEYLLVTFSEPIASGTDNPADWRFYETVSGAGFVITRVSAFNATQRRLDLGPHDPYTSGSTLGLTYDPPASSAYADRAGNTVAAKQQLSLAAPATA